MVLKRLPTDCLLVAGGGRNGPGESLGKPLTEGTAHPPRADGHSVCPDARFISHSRVQPRTHSRNSLVGGPLSDTPQTWKLVFFKRDHILHNVIKVTGRL